MTGIGLITAFALLLGSSNGFTVAPSSRVSFSNQAKRSSSAGPALFMENASAPESTNNEVLVDEEALWQEQLKSEEVQEVRQEMILKYISMGRTQEFAEAEVDDFLSDRERSQKFLEMRRYAAAQADDLGVGPFLYGGAFFLGLLGTVGMKYFNEYQALHSGGGIL